MFDERTLRASDAPGSLGPLDDPEPRLTLAAVRPFLWALLLLKGRLRHCELTSSMVAALHEDDLRLAEDSELTVVELLASEAIDEQVKQGRLAEIGEGAFELLPGGGEVVTGLQQLISVACATNSRLPASLKLP